MIPIFEKAAHYANGGLIAIQWVGTDGAVVDQDAAQRRADTCLKCPCRIPTPAALGFAADSIKSILELKNHLQLRVNGEEEVGSCKICDCVNRLKVWMPIEQVRKDLDDDEFARLDLKCWIRSELQA